MNFCDNIAADITEQPRDNRDVPRNNCKCKINIVGANCVRPLKITVLTIKIHLLLEEKVSSLRDG